MVNEKSRRMRGVEFGHTGRISRKEGARELDMLRFKDFLIKKNKLVNEESKRDNEQDHTNLSQN